MASQPYQPPTTLTQSVTSMTRSRSHATIFRNPQTTVAIANPPMDLSRRVGYSSDGLSPFVHNEYPDKRILSAISSRTCRIEFSNAKFSSTNYHTINGMSVLSPDSETVRKSLVHLHVHPMTSVYCSAAYL